MSLPSGWKSGTLRDAIASIKGGYSVKCEDRRAIDCEFGVLKTGSILNGKLDLSQNKYVPSTEHSLLRTYVRANTIIFCRKNSEETIGTSAIARTDAPNIFLSDLLWEIIPSKSVSKYWLLNTLQSARMRALIRLQATGTQSTMKNISQDRLLSIPIDIPPIHEQRKIAEILRAWDKAIDKLEALINLEESQYIALTSSLVFGSRRLERFKKLDKVTAHRWFELPEEWSCLPIGSLATEISERNASGDAFEVLSCSKHDGFVRSLEYFKKQVFSLDLANYKKIWRGDFGFPSNHVEEGSIGLQNLVDVGIVSPIYIVFRFQPEKVNQAFAFSVLKTNLYRHIFEVSTSASVDRRGSLRWDEFAKIPFPVPPLAEQGAISEVLTAHADKLAILKEQRSRYERQKRGLMQKLLTGEWRVTGGEL